MQRGISRAVAFAAAVLAAAFLCGCTRLADVNLRLVVHAVGVDIIDDGIWRASYQVFNAQPAQEGGPVDATDQNVVTIVTYGRSLYETQKSLELQTGKEVLTGDVELIVLGRGFTPTQECIGEDISGVLSYFWNNYDIYMGVNVVFSEGDAADIVSAELEHGTAAAELLNRMILSAQEYTRTVPTRLIEASNHLSDECSGFMVPMMSAYSTSVPEGLDGADIYDKYIAVTASVLVSGGVPVKILAPQQSQGVSILSGRADKLSYELMCDGKRVSAEIDVKKIERKISLSEASDAESEKMLVPVLDVTLHGKVKLKDYPDGYDENAVIAAAEQMIKDVCSQGREAVSAYPCDALGILRMLKRYQNEFYNRSSGEYESLLGGAVVNVGVKLDITE